MKITKEKVVARLVKWGHNEARSKAWVNEHFEYAVKYYNTVSKVAEVVSSL